MHALTRAHMLTHTVTHHPYVVRAGRVRTETYELIACSPLPTHLEEGDQVCQQTQLPASPLWLQDLQVGSLRGVGSLPLNGLWLFITTGKGDPATPLLQCDEQVVGTPAPASGVLLEVPAPRPLPAHPRLPGSEKLCHRCVTRC